MSLHQAKYPDFSAIPHLTVVCKAVIAKHALNEFIHWMVSFISLLLCHHYRCRDRGYGWHCHTHITIYYSVSVIGIF